MKQCERREWQYVAFGRVEEEYLNGSLRKVLKEEIFEFKEIAIENDILKADFSTFEIGFFIDEQKQLPPYILLKNKEQNRGKVYEYYAIAFCEEMCLRDSS